MSSRCRSAACIIGRSIARSTSSTGGHGWASIQSPSQTSSGLKLIRASRSPPNTFKLTPSAPSRPRHHDIAQTIEANRRNAENSTGPRSDAGKQRSSRNAVRHGLTAESVIELLEDAEDHAAFEEAIAVSFDPETAVERELILRLAVLLWWLWRATSIETALFQMKIEHDSGPQPVSELSRSPPSRLVGIHVAPAGIRPRDDVGVIGPLSIIRTIAKR